MAAPKVGQVCFGSVYWYMLLSVKRAVLENLNGTTTEAVKARFGCFYIEQDSNFNIQFKRYFEYEFKYHSLDNISLMSIS